MQVFFLINLSCSGQQKTYILCSFQCSKAWLWSLTIWVRIIKLPTVTFLHISDSWQMSIFPIHYFINEINLKKQTTIVCLIRGTIYRRFWFSYILFIIITGGDIGTISIHNEPTNLKFPNTCSTPFHHWLTADFTGTFVFISVSTRAHHLFLRWATTILSTTSHPTDLWPIIILASHLQPGLESGLFPSRFPTKAVYALLIPPPQTCHMSHSPHYLYHRKQCVQSSDTRQLCLYDSPLSKHSIFRKISITECV